LGGSRSLITAAAEAGKAVVDFAVHVGIKPDSPSLSEFWEFSSPCLNHQRTDRFAVVLAR